MCTRAWPGTIGTVSATRGRSATASGALLLSLSVFLSASPVDARASSWTNQAGKAIEAEALSLERGVVTLQRPDGETMRVLFTAFSPGSQQRLRKQFKVADVPDHILLAHRDATAMVQRYDRLPDDRKSEGGRDAVVRAARTLFDHRVAAGAGAPHHVTDRREIERLRRTIR